MMDESVYIQYFIGFINQVKLFHWTTTSYAKHKALDDLHSSLQTKVDKFIETFIGRHKKQPIKKFTMETKSISDATKIEAYLDAQLEHINTMLKSFAKSTELQNILQEIMADIGTTLYLCNLS